jgi:hypothetical protein
MTISIKIVGLRAHDDALRKIESAAKTNVDRAVLLGGEDLRSEIVRRIQRGSRSGRVYKRGSRTHQASAPGEYPKSDSGRLASHVFMRRVEPAVAEVGTAVVHGRPLEEGTSKMAPRPWLNRTFDDLKPRIVARIRRAIAASLRTK